jgi:hypothetical protein
MLKIFNDSRDWNFAKRVKIYRNLHKKCLSIQVYCKVAKGYRVWAHCDGGGYILNNLDVKVNENDRQKVIKTKSKNVHAFITGEWTGLTTSNTSPKALYYNPYITPTFVIRQDIVTRTYANGNSECRTDITEFKAGVKGIIGYLKIMV